ncbi:amidohydrolase [Saccharothrix luteola]|uniref:amidohydrolase n=1 Tax=Saccharothrix luteola TaxID=2893018 RepID=UPI001E402BF9|nr:amidohydrolase [Saccharothrix luteola]MCC8247963.1 amidohydrolase [Saccharothrix luteola]
MNVAITGGYVVPVAGEPIDGGTVLVQDGKIVAVGADVEVPDGVPVVDAAGGWVLPGFVEAHGHLGVHEEGEGWAGQDTNEMTDPNGARLRALDAINAADQGFADALAGGVTTAVVKPGSGNVIGGQTVAVKCWGRTADEMLVRNPVSVKSALGENPKRVYGEQKKLPSTRQGVAAVIRDAFTKAQDYVAKRDSAEDGAFERNTTSEVLARVLSGELPWCQHCHRADDIATALRLAEEFGYRLIVNHGTEGHLIADVLAERGIPVIIGPLFTSRSKVEVRNRSLRNPGILARAGVQIAITTDHPVVPIHFLVHQVTLAVKEGLDPRVGLESITVNPARIMGLDDRVGSLRPGLDGDVVIWSGDPLDVMSRALKVYVEGREVYRYENGEEIVTNPFYREP